MLTTVLGGKSDDGKPAGKPPQPRPMTADRWRSMARRHNDMMRAKKHAAG